MSTTPCRRSIPSGLVQAHAFRLQPGDDLVTSLTDAATGAIDASPEAGSAFILSAVGSLSDVSLRLATASNGRTDSASDMKRIRENVEVVSLVGTFTPIGQKHLHISVSNGKGETFGGHLVAGVVFTTLEVVLGTISNVSFSREHDERTGYTELVVTPTSASDEAQATGKSKEPPGNSKATFL